MKTKIKITPAHLFFLLTLVALPLTIYVGWASAYSWKEYEGSFAINYLHYFVPISILAGLTGSCYFIFEKTGRPISNRTGYWHFCLVALGLYFSVDLFRLIEIMLFLPNPPDVTSFGSHGMVFLGPVILVISATVFVIGLIKAIGRRA